MKLQKSLDDALSEAETSEDVSKYIKLGANVNVKNHFGNTPLMSAAADSRCENIRELLSAGSDVNAQNSYQNTALYYAIAYDRPEAVSILLEAGADISIKFSFGQKVIHYVQSIAVLRLLISNGADPDARDNSGENLLYKIRSSHLPKNKKLIEFLVKELCVPDESGPESVPSIDLIYSVDKKQEFTVGKCVKCNSDTVRHSDDDHIIDGSHEPFELIVGGKEFSCSSNHDHRDFEEIWHICTNCGERSLECPDCNKYCRLTLFPGQPISDIMGIDGNHFRIARQRGCEWVFVRVDNDEDSDSDDEYLNHTLVPKEMKVYSFSHEKWYPNGMDGSQYNAWKCDQCGKVIENFDG